MRNRVFKASMERYESLHMYFGVSIIRHFCYPPSHTSSPPPFFYSSFPLKFSHRSPFTKSKSRSADHDDIFNAQNTRNTGYIPPLIPTGPVKQIHDEKPTGITEGWLEKKKSSKMFSMGPEWQKR
jgi:hypothetical protein